MTAEQAVRFRDHLIQIQTVLLNGVECLCFDDVQRRCPSVAVLSLDQVQLTFLRDDNGGDCLKPLRIAAVRDRVIDALEPMSRSDTASINHVEAKLDELNRKTDLVLANTQETLVRIKHVMTQMYELHEYTTPRYFFILPVKHHSWTSVNTVQNWFLLHYRLYFLCECSNEPGELHIAPHEGYLIKRPSEFIAHYGSYLRSSLNLARSALSAGGFAIPHADSVHAALDASGKLDLIETMLHHHHLESDVPLQGAQLRELAAFLDRVDDARSLGNLYRTTTDDGHVRWVCLEHYNAIRFNSRMSEYVQQWNAMGGSFDQESREASLSSRLTSRNVQVMCEALTKGFTVQTLRLQGCSIDSKNLDQLLDTVVNRSSLHRLILKSVEVRTWMKMSKYYCTQMTVCMTNQSLQVQFARGHQDDVLHVLFQLLGQNRICRTLHLFGYDFTAQDRELVHRLNESQQLTTLVIHHRIGLELLEEIVTKVSSLRQLKLGFCLNSSSMLMGLCRAIESNGALIELDIMDQTWVDEQVTVVELLKVVRVHRSMRSLRLHVIDVQPASRKETCLIDALFHDTFISHLRISESVVSHSLTLALLHACREARSLTHVELYSNRIDHKDLADLQLSHAQECLMHLKVCDTPYWPELLTECQPYRNAELAQTIGQCSPPTLICLDGMELIDRDVPTIIKHAMVDRQCQLLSLQSNKLTSVGLSLLADALQDNTTLETLHLGSNCISDDGVHSLSRILTNSNRTLQTLLLQDNQISDRGVKHLADMLQSNRTLLWLYLDSNDITDRGIRLLAESIGKYNSSLEMLVLSSNSRLTDSSADELLRMIECNRSLKKLWIENCNLSDTSKKALRQLQQSKTNLYIRL